MAHAKLAWAILFKAYYPGCTIIGETA